MSELIANKDWKYESSLDNVTEELLWVKNQIQKELANLQQDVQEDQIKKSFFERTWDKVEYHMDLVVKYLQSCIENEDFQVNSAVVMAVQIALELIEYDVWKIDWLLTRNSWKLSKTQKALRLFQKNNKIRVDWFPWKETIQKILDILWNSQQTEQLQENDENISMQENELKTDNWVPEWQEDSTQWTEEKEVNKDVKINLDKEWNLENLQEILDARNLILPKLKASDVSEVWWFWNITMQSFQSCKKDLDTNFRHIVSGPRSTSSHPRANNEYLSTYHEKNPNIKSFVIYFGWESENKKKTLNDISNRAALLSKDWIEPVLCTCAWDNKDTELASFNDSIRKLYENNKDKWYKLVDFAKINDLVKIKDETSNTSVMKKIWERFKSSEYSKSYTLMHDILYSCLDKWN